MAVACGLGPIENDRRVPRFADLAAGLALAAPPVAIDYTDHMPTNFGAMLNDNLNDCQCAAFYHARQIWTFNATGNEVTEGDQTVKQLYQEAAGYDQAAGPPGPTLSALALLKFLISTGAPIEAPPGRDVLSSFVKIAPEYRQQIQQSIYSCGAVLVGFPMNEYIKSDPPVWEYRGNSPYTGERHAIILAGYSDVGVTAISWGKLHHLTWEFVNMQIDEAYGLVDRTWAGMTNKTLAGRSLLDLQAAVEALRQ